MKRKLLTVVILLMTMSSFTQTQTEKYLNQRNENCIRTYRLIPTIHWLYFIKLNTRTGQLWQIENEKKEGSQLEIPLNSLSLIEKEKEVDDRFTLYPTENPYTFLLLDQINGKIWQARWDIKQKKSEILSLNSSPLIEEQKEVDNRFTLYPTENPYTFLLLDQINGKIWQAQWDIKPKKLEILTLNSSPLIEEQKEVDNRFTLYPTENPYTFLLLDKINGKIKQVRWDLKSEKIEIKPI